MLLQSNYNINMDSSFTILPLNHSLLFVVWFFRPSVSIDSFFFTWAACYNFLVGFNCSLILLPETTAFLLVFYFFCSVKHKLKTMSYSPVP